MGLKIIRKRISLNEIAEARKFDPGDHFLLQEYVVPQMLDQSPAWFRVFYLFGEIFPCWWNPQDGRYRQVTIREIDKYRLIPLIKIPSEIATVVRIEWFSCEIAIQEQIGRFVVIDYMNDQCDVSSQSFRYAGVPDDLLLLIARRMVEKAWQHIRGTSCLNHRAVWFPQIKIQDGDT
jgi:hypothetical protein